MASPTQDWPIATADSRGTASRLRRRRFPGPMRPRSKPLKSTHSPLKPMLRLGLVLHHRWDWTGAETEFKRALQLDPRYANAHHWYGDYLSIRGRHDEALLEARQAFDLDPLNLMIGTWVGLRYYLARKYERAIEQGRNTVELDPNFAAAHLLLGEAYVQKGFREKGLAELQSAASLSGNSPLYLAQVAVAYASMGRKTEALQIVAQLQTTSS